MDAELVVNGRTVEVDTGDDDEVPAAVARLLARADELDGACRAAIAADLEAGGDDGAAALYLDHHLGELPDLARALGHADAPATDPALRRVFVARLVLRSIWSGHGDDQLVRFDYSIDPDRTQYVLCVSLDLDGALVSVEMES